MVAAKPNRTIGAGFKSADSRVGFEMIQHKLKKSISNAYLKILKMRWANKNKAQRNKLHTHLIIFISSGRVAARGTRKQGRLHAMQCNQINWKAIALKRKWTSRIASQNAKEARTPFHTIKSVEKKEKTQFNRAETNRITTSSQWDTNDSSWMDQTRAASHSTLNYTYSVNCIIKKRHKHQQ